MRARIHLNLAAPLLAENVIKIQSPSGAWVTVAYAQMVVFKNTIPVVNESLRVKVEQGHIKKTPHAFLEGDLEYFQGRIREKAPPVLKKSIQSFEKMTPGVKDIMKRAQEGHLIGYNPRFANCFYKQELKKENIQEKLESAKYVTAIGWAFFAHHPVLTLMNKTDRSELKILEKTSAFEKQAVVQGHKKTQALINLKNK